MVVPTKANAKSIPRQSTKSTITVKATRTVSDGPPAASDRRSFIRGGYTPIPTTAAFATGQSVAGRAARESDLTCEGRTSVVRVQEREPREPRSLGAHGGVWSTWARTRRAHELGRLQDQGRRASPPPPTGDGADAMALRRLRSARPLLPLGPPGDPPHSLPPGGSGLSALHLPGPPPPSAGRAASASSEDQPRPGRRPRHRGRGRLLGGPLEPGLAAPLPARGGGLGTGRAPLCHGPRC